MEIFYSKCEMQMNKQLQHKHQGTKNTKPNQETKRKREHEVEE